VFSRASDASTLGIVLDLYHARMHADSFNSNANLSISSSVMLSAPCLLCRRVEFQELNFHALLG